MTPKTLEKNVVTFVQLAEMAKVHRNTILAAAKKWGLPVVMGAGPNGHALAGLTLADGRKFAERWDDAHGIKKLGGRVK